MNLDESNGEASVVFCSCRYLRGVLERHRPR